MTTRVFTAAVLGTLAGCIPDLPNPENPCAPYPETGLFKHTVSQEGGGDRVAYVWVPEGAGPRPVVVMLHGAGGNHRRIADTTQWIRQANQHGMVVVFPNGRGIVRAWNAGGCCGFSGEERNAVEDVAFLDALTEQVSQRTCGAEVLASGYSAGGMMVHRWGCESDVPDAVMPVAGPLMVDTCEGEPKPIRHYHGTEDPTVPIEGGPSRRNTMDYRSAEESLAIWRVRNECSDAEPTVFEDGDVVCQQWDCAARTELCEVVGWDHRWPGGVNRQAGEHDATREGSAWFRDVYDL